MTVYLDTNDVKLAELFSKELALPLKDGSDLAEYSDYLDYNSGEPLEFVVYGEDIFDPAKKNYRLFHTLSAEVGDSYFSNKLEAMDSPMFRGKIETGIHTHTMVNIAKYATSRAQSFFTSGVSYIGRTYTDPKYILVVDNKKSWIADAGLFLDLITPDLWKDVGVVSTANVAHYVDFFEEYCYAVPLAYSTYAKAKLNSINVPFCEIPEPGTLRSYGVTVRHLAGERSRELYLGEQTQV